MPGITFPYDEPERKVKTSEIEVVDEENCSINMRALNSNNGQDLLDEKPTKIRNPSEEDDDEGPNKHCFKAFLKNYRIGQRIFITLFCYGSKV